MKGTPIDRLSLQRAGGRCKPATGPERFHPTPSLRSLGPAKSGKQSLAVDRARGKL